MNFLRETLYCALNNTRLEDLVIHIDDRLRLWPLDVWDFPEPPLINWRWETKDHPDGKMRHVLCHGPDGTKLLEIARYRSSEVNYHWHVFNPKEDPTDRVISLGSFSIEVTRYQQDRVEIELLETDGTKVKQEILRWLEEHWKGQYEILDLRHMPRHRQEPWWLPIEPPTAGHEGYTRSDVFDWYHRGGKYFIPELKMLAPYLLVAESNVYNAHSEHKDLYPTGRKPDAESHFRGMFLPPMGEE
jgi:hypothetical protein